MENTVTESLNISNFFFKSNNFCVLSLSYTTKISNRWYYDTVLKVSSLHFCCNNFLCVFHFSITWKVDIFDPLLILRSSKKRYYTFVWNPFKVLLLSGISSLKNFSDLFSLENISFFTTKNKRDISTPPECSLQKKVTLNWITSYVNTLSLCWKFGRSWISERKNTFKNSHIKMYTTLKN